MKRIQLVLFLSLCISLHGFAQQPSSASANRETLITLLNQRAQRLLQQREQQIATIHSLAAVKQRKQQVQAKIHTMLGEFPSRPPMHARVVGQVEGDGFRVEKLLYDSLPGHPIPANLYLPEIPKTGPYPAVLYTPGHGPAGKTEAYDFAGNMARHGIAVLAWDPIGEGERLQYPDSAGGYTVGRATGEHGMASIPGLLLGEPIARDFLWDAMRGVDYLQSRTDIDASRIGAFGCSGGGTVTAYLAALDDRVQVAATACYITSFSALLSTAGPQDAEQSIPGFLADGLDFADWIELAAPKPYAVVSTTEDMFPFEGARYSVDEARRMYGYYGDASRLEWITGPGHHGNLQPVQAQIIHFFLRWLARNDGKVEIKHLELADSAALRCTSHGQIVFESSSTTLPQIKLQSSQLHLPASAQTLMAAKASGYRASIQQKVRSALRLSAQVEAWQPVQQEPPVARDAYTLYILHGTASDGMPLLAAWAVPNVASRLAPLLLLEAGDLSQQIAIGSRMDAAARRGRSVLLLLARPSPIGAEEKKSDWLGNEYLLSLRAMLIGTSLPAMRVQDALQALQWIHTQPDDQNAFVDIEGSGEQGVVALHTAALADAIGKLTLRNTLISYEDVLHTPLHRNIPAVLIPGVLRSYDLGDLMLAVRAREIHLQNPVDAAGDTLTLQTCRAKLRRIIAAEKATGRADRIRIDILPAPPVVR